MTRQPLPPFKGDLDKLIENARAVLVDYDLRDQIHGLESEVADTFEGLSAVAEAHQRLQRQVGTLTALVEKWRREASEYPFVGDDLAQALAAAAAVRLCANELLAALPAVEDAPESRVRLSDWDAESKRLIEQVRKSEVLTGEDLSVRVNAPVEDAPEPENQYSAAHRDFTTLRAQAEVDAELTRELGEALALLRDRRDRTFHGAAAWAAWDASVDAMLAKSREGKQAARVSLDDYAHGYADPQMASPDDWYGMPGTWGDSGIVLRRRIAAGERAGTRA